MEPLVSIIIPVYGVEKYIAKCLESVIAQTHKNLEAIVVNDGTKDKSAEIAKEYAKKDSRIKVYDFENGGVSVARNRGLSLAEGDYITFVDGDDWINECMLQELVDCAVSTDADMIKFGVEEIDLEINKRDLITFKNKQVFEGSLLEKYFEGVLWIMPCNALYKRELALQVKFPEHLTYEDNYTAAMYLALAKKVLVVPGCYYYYRVNRQGASKGGMKYPLDKCLVIKKLIEDLRGIGVAPDLFYWKFAVEVYHFVRGWNEKYRVKTIEQKFYKNILKFLDFRRKISLWFEVKKNGIRII